MSQSYVLGQGGVTGVALTEQGHSPVPVTSDHSLAGPQILKRAEEMVQ